MKNSNSGFLFNLFLATLLTGYGLSLILRVFSISFFIFWFLFFLMIHFLTKEAPADRRRGKKVAIAIIACLIFSYVLAVIEQNDLMDRVL